MPHIIPRLGYGQDQLPIPVWMIVDKPHCRLGVRYRSTRHAVVCADLLGQSAQGHHARLAEGFRQSGQVTIRYVDESDQPDAPPALSTDARQEPPSAVVPWHERRQVRACIIRVVVLLAD
jgi:hypothetical protein